MLAILELQCVAFEFREDVVWQVSHAGVRTGVLAKPCHELCVDACDADLCAIRKTDRIEPVVAEDREPMPFSARQGTDIHAERAQGPHAGRMDPFTGEPIGSPGMAFDQRHARAAFCECDRGDRSGGASAHDRHVDLG